MNALAPATSVAARLSERLTELASQIRRLEPPNRHDPERWHIAKSDLAWQVATLAKQARRLG
jgi:hypothetical protein